MNTSTQPMDSATFARSLQDLRVWEFRTVTTPVQTCWRLRGSADVLYQNDKYADAQLKYAEAIKAIVSIEVPLPMKEGMRNEAYMNLDWWGRIELMACCNGMARCMVKLDDFNKVTVSIWDVTFLIPILSGRLLNGSTKLIRSRRTVSSWPTLLILVS